MSVRCHLGQTTPGLLRLWSCPDLWEKKHAHDSCRDLEPQPRLQTRQSQCQQRTCVSIPGTQGSPPRPLVPWLHVPTCEVEQAGRSSVWKIQLEIAEEEYGAAVMENQGGISRDNIAHPAAAKPGSNTPVMLLTDVCLSSPGNLAQGRSHFVLWQYIWGFVVLSQMSRFRFPSCSSDTSLFIHQGSGE